MKSLLESRPARAAVAALAALGLSASLATGVAAAKPASSVERTADADSKSKDDPVVFSGQGRKVG